MVHPFFQDCYMKVMNTLIWISITFLIVLTASLFIILTVGEHFIQEHVLNHIIKKHFIRIFLWTFFTLLLIYFLDQFIDLKSIIGDNLYIVLLIAVLVGVIPESGPTFSFYHAICLR